MKINALYIHGFMGTPNGGTYTALKNYFKDDAKALTHPYISRILNLNILNYINELNNVEKYHYKCTKYKLFNYLKIF